MESLKSHNKDEVRQVFREKRASITLARRDQAKFSLLHTLAKQLGAFEYILSFASFKDEIDSHLLNLYLLRSKRLILPKMDGDKLQLFEILNIEEDLAPNSFGLLEPIPRRCSLIQPTQIQVALIPALGFDKSKHRIGYGKGYYDKLISSFSDKTKTLGIGFEEQLTSSLPVEPHDAPLDKLYLF